MITTATNAVPTMEGDSVESYGKPAFTKKNWASKAWATVGDIANSANRVVLLGPTCFASELRQPLASPNQTAVTASRSPQPS
jgi:hypothetical protein